MSIEDVKNSTYTDGYIYPPSAKNQSFSKDDDWYSLAVQAFYYLTYAHPFNKSTEGYIERMEKGISLLGNHGLTPPNIYTGCDFMSEELKTYFFETFEGKRRESLLPVLNSYYSKVYPRIVFNKVANDKTIFFDRDTNNLFIKGIGVCSISGIRGFKISDDNSMILFYDNKTVVVDTENKEVKLVLNKGFISNAYNVSSTSNALYFMKDYRRISKLTNTTDTDIFLSASSERILRFRAISDDEFVVLKKSNLGYLIHCGKNDFDFVFDKSDELAEEDIEDYIILYDTKSKKWLVIWQYTNGARFVVINPDGKHDDFVIKDISIGYSQCFYNNTLYYTTNRKISCLSISKKEILNTIRCDVVNNNSIIKRVDNKFIIYNEDGVYEYVKQ